MVKVQKALLDAKILEEDKIFSSGKSSLPHSHKCTDDSKGPRKVLTLTKLPISPVYRQIDVRICPIQSLPYMLVGNTGDDQLMRRLRFKAERKGWVLNEYEMGPRLKGTVSCPADS
jgi:DNA polymerase beta